MHLNLAAAIEALFTDIFVPILIAQLKADVLLQA